MSTPEAPPAQGSSMSLTYRPPPHELPYYDALFQHADANQRGILGGAEAVQFLSRSQIATPTLKNIWNMADQNPKTNTLDKTKFFIAVRLIQLFQNGQRPQGSTLAVAEEDTLKAAHFEGLSGSMIPIPLPPSAVSGNGTGNMTGNPSPEIPPPSMVQPTEPTPVLTTTAGDTSRNHVTALTAQDPYVMYPHEQSRYDALFPNYEKLKDGYVYGAEAVTLFSKSGLSKDHLRDIWNLADNPVDNRLDKVEFAIAMHLIVCISKKSLELPAVLPASLQVLKPPSTPIAAPPLPLQPQPPQPQPQPPQPQPQLTMMNGTDGNTLPPPSPLPAPPAPAPVATMEPAGMPEPPNTSTMSISDAFSDIPVPQLGGAEPTIQQDHTMAPPTMENYAPTLPPSLPTQPTIPTNSQPQPLPPTLQEQPFQPLPNMTLPPSSINLQEDPLLANPSPLLAPTNMVTDIPEPTLVPTTTTTAYEYTEQPPTELEKLQQIVTQLQAENISLKAQKQSTLEDESDTKDEIAAIVTEIEHLSKELQGLRHEVSEAKASLIEAVSELKGHKVTKNNLTETIAHTKETLNVLNSTAETIQEIPMEQEVLPPSQPNLAPAPEMDFFGGFGQPPAPAPAPVPVPMQTSTSVPSFVGDGSINGVHTTASSASSLQHHQQQQHQLQQHQQQLNPVPPEQMNTAPTAYNGFPNDAHAVQMQHPPIQQQPNLVDGAQGAMLMGGMMAPQMANPVNPTAYTQPPQQQRAAGPPAPSQEEVSKMKLEALTATDVATEAEQEQQLAYLREAELQRSAEEAETTVRQLQENLSKKSKGFKRSKQKAQKKEYELALQKAVELKKEVSEAQGKITQLQVVTMKAKREADRLRQLSEQAEFDMAKAASVQEMHHPHVPPPNPNLTPQMYAASAMPVPNGAVPAGSGPVGATMDASSAFDNPFQTFGY